VILTSVPSAGDPLDDGHRRRYDTASLLDVAVQVFTERGYDGTSMGDLAHASGLSKSSLYHHFESKEQLLRVHGNTPTERWALERRREFDRIVAELVAQAAAEGDVRTDVQAGLVTRLLFGMINSLVEWYRPDEVGGAARRGTSSRAVSADELADAVVRLAFEGLRR
jgi:AcrR family transcriptional regulator